MVTRISIHFLFSRSKVIGWTTYTFLLYDRSSCDGYQDKHPLPVFKVKDHWVTLHFVRYTTLIMSGDPKIASFLALSVMVTEIDVHFLFSRSSGDLLTLFSLYER